MSLLAAAITFAAAGCKSSAQAAMQEPGAANPADANMATVPLQGNAQQNEAAQQAGTYQNGQPTSRTNQAPAQQQQQQVYQDPNQQQVYQQQQQQDPNAQYSDDDQYADQGADALDAVVADQAPPELPQYDQPEAPGPDYLWTPGYWDYAPVGYYWVPGAWVYPPYVGALWTPGYWGYTGGRYRFRHGYWGPHVGFYGGINYGFGYIGFGYQGGYWNNNHFYYNRVVNRVPARVTYVYNRNITVVNRTYINNTRVAFYGGNGGINRAPAPQERVAFHEQHVRPMTAQVNMRQQAEQNRGNFFSQNRGRPQEAAFNRPLNADRGFQRPAPMPQADVNRFAMGRAVQQQQNRPGQPQQQQDFNRGGFGQNRPQPAGPTVAPQNRPDFNRGNVGANNAMDVQRNMQNQQRDQQRQQFDQQRQQQDQQRQQQAQQNQQQRQQMEQQQQQQRQQQANVQQQQRQQMQQQRDAQVQNQQRVQQMQQRQQQNQQVQQQRQQAQQQQMQQRQAQQQQQMQQRQQQAPRMEAPRVNPGGGGGHPGGPAGGGHEHH